MAKSSYENVFDRMMERLGSLGGDEYLEECMTMDPTILKNIPRRYRLIALGFYKGYTLKQLNDRLLRDGCEKLYARSLLEAELIYAFSRQMPYEDWKRMHQDLRAPGKTPVPPHGILNGKNLCAASLKDYIVMGSDESGAIGTLHVTRSLEKKIAELPDDEKEFAQFLRENISKFSDVREKARYYYCKYLYAYLECRIMNCISASEKRNMDRNAWEEALCEMTVLRGLTRLKRERMDPDEMERFLLRAPLSCGGVYDAFNYFYFEYVSCDWMQVLMEYFGEPISIPEERKGALADSIRTYHPEWKDLDDQTVIKMKYDEAEREEAMLDEAYSLSGSSRGYQRNRRGEKSIRSYITGELDIDRTTLICYLIFFDRNTDYDMVKLSVQPLTQERLDQILAECGFPSLRREDDLDSFILEYLHAEDPVDYLMECVTSYALENRNFFLYHMYNSSVSNEEQLGKLL